MKSRRQALKLCLDTAVVIIVKIFDELLFEVFHRIKFLQIEQFAFEQTKEVFYHSIVQTITFPAHALPYAFLTKHPLVLFILVLPALIGMKDQTGSIRYFSESLLLRCPYALFLAFSHCFHLHMLLAGSLSPSKMILYFSKSSVEDLVTNMSEANPLTAAFEKELDKMGMNYSYKPLLLLALFSKESLSAKVEEIIDFYFTYYSGRAEKGQVVEKGDINEV